MPDKMTPQQRHNCMSHIRSKNTRPEVLVRQYLHAAGFRFRILVMKLPGWPDVVLPKYRTCIFVNGCVWHGHRGCRYAARPKSNAEFWQTKINRNKERDTETQRKLASMGWHCITIWECQLKPKVRQATLESLEYTLSHIFLQDHKVKKYKVPEEEISIAAEPEHKYQ